ncbi:chemotaxis response regulator protein-glutamate methylesterase [Bacillus sp. 03113]|uniref:protein-glutamate methylesterase/protein-glutamine glutaminase n=1 Tax=Bacillus sp. 03113 TaxID=2578211 RepID=UPI00114370FD|nr:chemotaxis response regulator protein-glutamate methylesterase [Bacillus sp. 03113]
MEIIKVLIVDDSAFMRKLITEFLSENPLIQVIGTARNGEDAIKKVKQLKPTVVTLDVEMPILNGIEALKIIMKENPVPVVMLSSLTKEGAESTLQAIQLGAVDFIAKPSGAISLDLYKIKVQLQEKVISACKANIQSMIKFSKRSNSSTLNVEDCSKIELCSSKAVSSVNSWNHLSKKIICIGTSTGGPRALQQVLSKLPKNISAPILVVQHMPPSFTKSLAKHLNSLAEINVKEAEEGELIKNGTAYIAPGGFHMSVRAIGTSLAIQLDQSPPINGLRPSVDVLFNSISKITQYSIIAVIMTGMGSDGAKGLVSLKKNTNVLAIAESKETAIIFGMPKAAIETSFVDKVELVEKIASLIMKYV